MSAFHLTCIRDFDSDVNVTGVFTDTWNKDMEKITRPNYDADQIKLYN